MRTWVSGWMTNGWMNPGSSLRLEVGTWVSGAKSQPAAWLAVTVCLEQF